MANEERQSLAGRFMSWLAKFPSRNMKEAPSFRGQMDALRRDALTDIRDTMNQVFFGPGAREGPGQPGMPLNPTSQMVTETLGTAGYQNLLDQYAARGIVHGRGQEKGKGMER